MSLEPTRRHVPPSAPLLLVRGGERLSQNGYGVVIVVVVEVVVVVLVVVAVVGATSLSTR